MNEHMESLRSYMAQAGGSRADICGEIFRKYLNPETPDRERLFRYFCENWQGPSPERSISAESFYTQDEYFQAINEIQDVAKKILSNLIEQNLKEDDFYSKLLNTLDGDTLYPSEIEKICALTIYTSSAQIPYFQLEEAVRMEDDQFREIADRIDRASDKMLFVLHRGYTQRTEIASQILRILDELEYEEKLVLLAQLQGFYEMQTINTKKQGKKKSANQKKVPPSGMPGEA